MRYLANRRPDFSVVFLNAGARIQHHYFLSAAPLRNGITVANPDWYAPATADPVAEMLDACDRTDIIG